MAPVVPDEKKIRAFASASAFEAWPSKKHDKETELWIKFYKKGSGRATVTYAEAVEAALCWGWIDGLVKSFDAEAYLQRFTPRKAKSVWSKINREHVARLTAAGRMTPFGQRHVDAAKADGRWESAYDPPSTMKLPQDFLSAVAKSKRAAKALEALDKQNRYAMAWRLANLKTAAGREKRIADYVAKLERGELIHERGAAAAPKPQKQRAIAKKPRSKKVNRRSRKASAR